MSLPALILLGVDCLTGLQLARIAWRRGVQVIGVADNPRSPYCRSRSIARLYASADFLADPTLTLDAPTDGSKPVLLACTDEFAWWIDTHQDLLNQNFNALFPAPGVMATVSDKRGLYHHALSTGITTPVTWFAESEEELKAQVDDFRYPLVLKPQRRSAAWEAASGNRKVIKITNGAELQALAPRLLKHGGLVLQQWIDGPDADTREVSLCLDRQQGLLAALALRKLRQRPAGAGTGTLAEVIDAPELIERAHELLRALAYAGPAQVEFKRDNVTGEYFLIEVNAGRAALNFPLFEANGIEFMQIYHQAARGLKTTAAERAPDVRAKWICWKRDVPAAFALWRRGELSLAQWRESLHGPRWAADVDWLDPLPMFADMGHKMTQGLRRAAD